jgi:hypothetical protein
MNTASIVKKLNKANKVAKLALIQNMGFQHTVVEHAEKAVVAAGKIIYKADEEIADAQSVLNQLPEY